MRAWIAALLLLLLLLPLSAQAQYLIKGAQHVYYSGNSNCAAAADLSWPGDNSTTSFQNNLPSIPGNSNRGAWNIIHKLAIPGVTLAATNNSLGGTSVNNLLCPGFACSDGATGTDWGTGCCPSADATGDQVCDLANDSTDDNDALCLANTIYHKDSSDGLDLAAFDLAILCTAGNECNNPGMTVQRIIDDHEALLTSIFGYHRINRIVLPKTVWPASRVDITNNTICANLWDDSCADAAKGGNDCLNTLEDFAADPQWLGRVQIDTCIYDAITENGTVSGQGTRHAAFTAEAGNGGIHTNVWGHRKYDAPCMLGTIGVPVTDMPPPTPQPVVGTVTDTTAEISFASVVADPDGDTLTCVVWAVEDGDWEGGYLQADRVHNGFGACRSLNGDVACTDCGDEQEDADCNTASPTNRTTDANANFWLTAADAPVVPDGVTETTRTFPDYFEVPGCGTGTATIHGLAAGTTYRVMAAAMPDLVVSTNGRVERGLLPSDISYNVTFTTEP